MALRKLTKHSVTGSLLIQYKYANIASGSTSGTGDIMIGTPLSMTPQYANSIIENLFSGDINSNDTRNNGTNQHFRVALYVNGHKEYEQTELLGGPAGGHEATHSGGTGNRIYQNAQSTVSLYNMRQSVGLVHAYSHGSLNKIDMQIACASYDNAAKTMTVSNGLLIAKEISVGIVGLNGPQ